MSNEKTISICGKFKRIVEHAHKQVTVRILLETEPDKFIDGLIFYSEYISLELNKGKMVGEYITVNMLERDMHDPALKQNIRANPNTSEVDLSLLEDLLIDSDEADESLEDTHLAVHPDEVDEKIYLEGAVISVKVNKHERDQEARKKCIEHFHKLRGCIQCEACEMSFDKEYAGMRADLIHIHHIQPISEIGHEYKVDPIKDLVPVCPNCHAVIHSRKPPYSIEEVSAMVRRVGPKGTMTEQ
jgi:hypothetical protein